LDHGLLILDSGLKDCAEGFYKYYSERENRLAALESGFIGIEIKNYPHATGGRISIKVEDSGKGFNYQTMMPKLAENKKNSGRGIPLVRSLCTDLMYYGCGNCVEAIYDW
jgi:anti-sigma regulatory factor (Ser/Thr protein kinase)